MRCDAVGRFARRSLVPLSSSLRFVGDVEIGLESGHSQRLELRRASLRLDARRPDPVRAASQLVLGGSDLFQRPSAARRIGFHRSTLFQLVGFAELVGMQRVRSSSLPPPPPPPPLARLGIVDRRQLVVGGLAVDLQHEHHRAHLDAVAGREQRFLHALGVEERAVGAAEVFDLQHVAVADEPAMLAGDVAERDAQVAVLASADDGHVARDGEAPPLPVRPEHHEYRLHG